MTRGGHSSTAMALAVGGFAFFGVATGVGWALGCILGSSGPDDAEIVYSTQGGRKSFLVHRTWTHQPLAWIGLLWFLVAHWTSHPLEYVAAGWLSSGLLHLAMDILTPMGIPLGWPTSNRTSLNLLPKGSREITAVVLVWAIIVCTSYAPWIAATLSPDKRYCELRGHCGYVERVKSFGSASWAETLKPVLKMAGSYLDPQKSRKL